MCGPHRGTGLGPQAGDQVVVGLGVQGRAVHQQTGRLVHGQQMGVLVDQRQWFGHRGGLPGREAHHAALGNVSKLGESHPN